MHLVGVQVSAQLLQQGPVIKVKGIGMLVRAFLLQEPVQESLKLCRRAVMWYIQLRAWRRRTLCDVGQAL